MHENTAVRISITGHRLGCRLSRSAICSTRDVPSLGPARIASKLSYLGRKLQESVCGPEIERHDDAIALSQQSIPYSISTSSLSQPSCLTEEKIVFLGSATKCPPIKGVSAFDQKRDLKGEFLVKETSFIKNFYFPLKNLIVLLFEINIYKQCPATG